LAVAATRRGADELGDAISSVAAKATGAPAARTAASAAIAILAAEARALGKPRPTLMSGAEQDTFLKDLLEGHRLGTSRGPDWADLVPPEATGIPAFREELRNLLMRAAEAGLGPEQLAQLGRDHRVPAWVAAGQVYAEYLDVAALKESPADQGTRFDPARVVAEAAAALRAWPSDEWGEPPSWDLIIVDDYQEATRAAAELWRECAARGARLVLIGNPDESVQAFRGALPSGLHTATLEGEGLGAPLMTLGPSHRAGPTLTRVMRTVTGQIPTPALGRARPDQGGAPALRADDQAEPVMLITAPHRFAEARAIAAYLRAAHRGERREAVPWQSMAVIARSRASLQQLRSDLLALEIPCESLGEGVALHLQPAVAPVIALLRAAAVGSVSEEEALAIMSSRVVGLDAVGLRRLRRALVREDRDAGRARASGQLLMDALGSPSGFASLDVPEAAHADRAAAALSATSRAISAGDTPAQVVWAAWASLGVADRWKAAALAGSAQDDADLDAMIALLREAQQFSERRPGASVGQFLDYVESQEFAPDSLAAQAVGPDVVAFATASSAAGREWDVVAIAGLEEGTWPRLRLRDTVLGAHRLAELVAGRGGDGAGAAVDPAAARAEVLADETRALAVAVSRARCSLLVTHVADGELRPSRFVGWIAAAADAPVQSTGTVRSLSDLRALVARLRHEAGSARPDMREGYVRLLAALARAGVAGADPKTWHGARPASTEAPFWDAADVIPVSPSKVDAVESCVLKWALQHAGGSREATSKQTLGTMIHEIAAEHPDGTHEELAAALEERWDVSADPHAWVAKSERAKADAMVRRLGSYLAERRGSEVLVEQPFSVEIGRARLAGQADRLEVEDGVARIVDLKTGGPISQADADAHGQLAMYQLAADLGGFAGVSRASGASLVFVGGDAKGAAVRPQAHVDAEVAVERLARVVDAMAAPDFEAVIQATCTYCPVKRSCPLQPEGARVGEA